MTFSVVRKKKHGTEGPTDRRTDTTSYRDAQSHLKTHFIDSSFTLFLISDIALASPQDDLVKLLNDVLQNVKENKKQIGRTRKYVKIYTDKINNIQGDIVELQKSGSDTRKGNNPSCGRYKQF